MPLKFLKMMFKLSAYPLVEDAAKAADLLLAADATADECQSLTTQLQDESYLAFMQMALPSWGKLSTPLLVVGGEKDQLLKPNSQKATAKKYAADCHIVKDAPHDQMLDKSWQTSAHIIESWLNQNFNRA